MESAGDRTMVGGMIGIKLLVMLSSGVMGSSLLSVLGCGEWRLWISGGEDGSEVVTEWRQVDPVW